MTAGYNFMAEQDKNNKSDYKSKAWESQADALKLTSDLWQSPLYIQKKGDTYLEKFPKEKQEKYQLRLARSVPRNKFRESIETMAGMVFKEDPAPPEAPTALKAMFTDIDGCGNNLHSFLLTSFEKYLRDGSGAILVNSTMNEGARAKASNDEQLTAADRATDIVFWSYIEASQIINHRYETINGVEVLTQATIESKQIEPNGEFGEIEVTRHYIFRRGSVEVRRFDEKQQEYVIEDDKGGPTGLEDISLVLLAPIGTAPPLLDLAMLTVSYYNKLSDFDNWCHIAFVPRQVIKLADEADATKYKDLNQSAEVGLLLFGEHAEASYLEVSGNGIELAMKRNAELAAEMAAIGVGLLAPSEVAPKSATEVVDTAGQRQSKLARFAREFENSVEKAFYFTAELKQDISGAGAIDLKDTENTSLKLKMDFDRLTFRPEQMAFIERLATENKLSLETWLELLPNLIEMPQGWSAEEELERINKINAVVLETPKQIPATV